MLKHSYIHLLLILITVMVFSATIEAESNVNFLNLSTKLYNDEEMVCLRELGDEFNWNFYFANPEKYVHINNKDSKVVLKLNQDKLNSHKLAISPVIIKGRTYISISSVNILLQELEQGAEQMLELLANLSVNKQKCIAGGKIIAVVELMNLSNKEVTLKYASGQLYDLCLLKDGEEVWRWSKGKFFTMALIKKQLPGYEKLKYKIEVPVADDLEPGNYILTGKITTENPMKLNEVKIVVQ